MKQVENDLSSKKEGSPQETVYAVVANMRVSKIIQKNNLDLRDKYYDTPIHSLFYYFDKAGILDQNMVNKIINNACYAPAMNRLCDFLAFDSGNNVPLSAEYCTKILKYAEYADIIPRYFGLRFNSEQTAHECTAIFDEIIRQHENGNNSILVNVDADKAPVSRIPSKVSF